MGGFVLVRAGCYKVRLPPCLTCFCTQLIPFPFLCHVIVQPGGPYQDTNSMMFGPSSYQNHEPNKSLYKLPSARCFVIARVSELIHIFREEDNTDNSHFCLKKNDTHMYVVPSKNSPGSCLSIVPLAILILYK